MLTIGIRTSFKGAVYVYRSVDAVGTAAVAATPLNHGG